MDYRYEVTRWHCNFRRTLAESYGVSAWCRSVSRESSGRGG